MSLRDSAACDSRWHLVGPTRAQPVCLECRDEPAPVASRERIAEVLAPWLEDHDVAPVNFGTTAQLPAQYRELANEATTALADAGVFREPHPECGSVDRTGQRRCVFTPGHHQVENWTSHGDRGGWTWNDRPRKVEAVCNCDYAARGGPGATPPRVVRHHPDCDINLPADKRSGPARQG